MNSVPPMANTIVKPRTAALIKHYQSIQANSTSKRTKKSWNTSFFISLFDFVLIVGKKIF